MTGSGIRFVGEATALAPLIRAGCTGWGIHDAEINLIKYRENWVFKVTTGHDAYALRVHRPGYQTRASIETEMQMLHALAAAGMPVPQACRTVDGHHVQELTGDDGTVHFVDMQRWVSDTVTLGDVVGAFRGVRTPPVTAIREIATLVAQAHGVLEDAVADGRVDPRKRPRWDRAGLVGPAPLWGDPLRLLDTAEQRRIVSAALARIDARLAELGEHDDAFGLIHGDLTFENILLGPEGPVLIDFDDAGVGWHLFDLATTLVFLTTHPAYPTYEAAALDGYASVRPITDAARRAWPDLLVARALTYLGWAADRRGDEAAQFLHEEFMPHVVGLAAHYLDDDRQRHQPVTAREGAALS